MTHEPTSQPDQGHQWNTTAGFGPSSSFGHTGHWGQQGSHFVPQQGMGMFGGTPPVGGPYPGMGPPPSTLAYPGFYPDAGVGPSSSSQPGFVSNTFVLDSGGFNLEDLDNFTSHSPTEQGDPDVLGSSQLGGAPLGYSQQQTPHPSLRPQRQLRSLDRHTYSQGHVHAQQRAKRVRHRRGG
ncbi:uncharacterized protein LOC120660946 [Panicum virgatum]|uniref:uncharacterized protein LOC120660946 n=1 Tax=Panicum virgatum TaxID=38727 RepID=UPI0019D588FD|nr:uncharacterized protein LOC120660946 [Panicum virgatum]